MSFNEFVHNIDLYHWYLRREKDLDELRKNDRIDKAAMKKALKLRSPRTEREQHEALISEWAFHCYPHSVPGPMMRHQAYKEIVSVGWPMVPLLVERLAATGCLFYSLPLRAITGAYPEKKHYDAGQIEGTAFSRVSTDDIAEAWVAWADSLQIAWRTV